MPDIKKMLEVCKFVVENHATTMDICEKFGMSRKTAQKHTGEYLKSYIAETNDELAKELLEKIEKIKSENEKRTQTQPVDVDLNEVVNHIINSKTTIEQASLMFGISESTLHKYIADIKESNQELYNRLLLVQEEVSKRGHILGGKTSIRGPKYTDFESVEIAETIIGDDLTLVEASMKFDVPKSSIYERVKAVNDEEIQKNLQDIFDGRKKKK